MIIMLLLINALAHFICWKAFNTAGVIVLHHKVVRSTYDEIVHHIRGHIPHVDGRSVDPRGRSHIYVISGHARAVRGGTPGEPRRSAGAGRRRGRG